MAKSSGLRNAPSATGRPSGGGRGNNAPRTSGGDTSNGNSSSGSKSGGSKGK